MWPFSKKASNRKRRENSFSLKTSTGGSPGGARHLAVLFFGVLGIALGAFGVWRGCEWLLARFLFENDTFAIRRIEVRTDGVLSTDQIRIWTMVRPGRNLLALDIGQVRNDLEQAFAIKSATVERVLPDTLRIRVMEREPLAQLLVPHLKRGGGYEVATYYLDEEGCVMPPLKPNQRATPSPNPPEQYPLITGLDLGEVTPGRKINLPQMRAALNLIAAFERSPMMGMDELLQIGISSEDTLVVTTGLGAKVEFSMYDLDRQFRRWREIHDQGQRLNRHLAWLDLAVTNNIPVKWMEAGILPAVPVRNAPPHRRRPA